MTLSDAFARLRPRPVHAISAVLLPYTPDGRIDWAAFERHVIRTRAAGLDVAVNMDAGFGDLLTPDERQQVLDRTRRVLGADMTFYAGAVAGPDGDLYQYHTAVTAVRERGAIPVIIQSRMMHGLDAQEKAAWYARICAPVDRALAFELGPMFAAHGEIWDDATAERVMMVPQIVGLKHSSLDRCTELGRLALRDRVRPEFRIYTGNDLAIDMVAYGSDYLLGLSTFAPDCFGRRDRALAAGDAAFLALNDALQHLGNVAFRAPVPAYKHAAAQFLHITGALDSDAIHPAATRRPGSDRLLLFDCACRLGLVEDRERVYRERVEPFL